MPQDPQIPTPLESGATDRPNAPQSAPSQAWYKVKGEDGKWYTTQSDSPQAAKTKIWQTTAKMVAAAAPQGEISARPQPGLLGRAWETAQDIAPVLKGDWLHQPMAPENVSQLAYPERAMSPEQQRAHPILTGAGQVTGGLTSADNILLTLMMAKAPAAIGKAASTFFTGEMATGAYTNFQAGLKAYRSGNTPEAERLWTHAGFSLAFAKLAANHSLKEENWVSPSKPEETTIAASGKTEAEAKAVPPSSPKTGLASKPQMSAEQIKARIAELEKRIAAQKTAPPVEPPKPAETPTPMAAKPAEVPKVEAKVAPAPEARPEPAPIEARPEVPKAPSVQDRLNKMKEASGLYWDIYEKRWLPTEEAKRAIPEPGAAPERKGPDWVQPSKLQEKQMAMKQRQETAQADVSQAKDLMAETRAARQKELTDLRAQRSEAPESAGVGREAAPPEAPKPVAKPVPPTQEAARPGEPVRPAEKPEVERTRLGSDNPAAIQARMDAIASQPKETGMRDFTKYPYGSIKGDKGYIEPRSVRGDLGERPPVSEPKIVRPPRDFAKEMEIMKTRVAEYQAKNPGVSKTHAQQVIAEQMRKERGAFGGGGPEERGQRREDKIKGWLDILRDPKASPESLDQAYKMLTKVYDFSHDDIIQRMAGGAEFAKTPPKVDPRTGIPEASQEGLEERTEGIIGDLSREVDKVMGRHEETKQPLTKPIGETLRDTEAMVEGRAVGQQDVKGVKSPDIEELDRMFKLKDERIEKKSREGERGSLSFRRLSPEERERANPLRRLADALDRVADIFEHGRLSAEEFGRKLQAKNIIRAAGAERARSNLEVENALKEAIERHDSPANERENFVQFMDAGEGKEGAQFLNPKDQALAQTLHEMFEERWEKVKEVKGLEGEGIENYLAHIWEKSGKAGNLLQGILTGRRPLEGSSRFLKNRFYQYASSGIDHGLTPVTWNPIRLQLGALFDVDRFLMAHDIKDRFVDAGLTKWHKLSDYKNVPPGWTKLDDKIFQPKVVGEGALKEYGTYFAPAEVAKVFNNYLSPGLSRNPVFKAFRTYGNTLNMINLGISAYHGTMISLVSATSDLALGMQKVLNYGDVAGGMKDMFRGTIGTFILRSAAHDFNLGRAIQAEAIDPTGNPALQKYVDAITQGGGRFKQDPFYSNTASERAGFKNWLKLAPQGKFLEMAQIGVRKLAGPIMEKFVPRVKLGVAGRMMEAKLADLASKGITDQNTISTELGKIWDSVDNRAGQMVYDNLFMNNVAKDLAFMSVRAVGWDLGSFREYGGGAVVDLPRQLAKGLRGERPELTSRLAFTIATPITIGLFGAMVHYVMTGKAPQKTEDYFFPGPDGAKVSFPSYMKDFYAFKSHPLEAAVNKLHPTWGQTIDFYKNADFYGTEIYHPGDPKLKQGYDILKWYGKSWEPLSYKGISTRIERGEAISSATTGMFGFMPAPSGIDQTKAEELAVELSRREWKRGPRTSADAERYQLVQKFERQVGAGQKIDMGELTKAWREKRIQDSDISKIYSNYKVPKLQREFKELPLPDALAVMREATPDERTQLKSLLLEKYGQLERYPLDTQQAYAKQIQSYLQ